MVMVEVQECEGSWRRIIVFGCVVVLGLHVTLAG